MPPRLRDPAKENEVEDPEGDQEDDQRQKKAIGAGTRNILWPDHANGQDQRDCQQTNTRQPVQPRPCREVLIHRSPAPLPLASGALPRPGRRSGELRVASPPPEKE